MKKRISFFEITSDVPFGILSSNVSYRKRSDLLIVQFTDEGLELSAGDEDPIFVIPIKLKGDSLEPLPNEEGENAQIWIDPDSETIYTTVNEIVVEKIKDCVSKMSEKMLALLVS